MIRKRIVFQLFFMLGFVLAVVSQTSAPRKVPTRVVDPKLTDEKFKFLDYRGALEDYLILITKEPKNEEYQARLATCYLNTNVNKTLAIPYLEALTKKDKCDPNLFFDLGMAYHYAYRFDDAINVFTKFKEKGKGKAEYLKVVEHYIQYGINAKELIKFPLNVTFENLGKNINSPFPDYYPFVPADESFIVYNSRRSGVKDEDGNFSSGIFISKLKDGEFEKSKSIGPPVNSGDGDKEVVGLSNLGDILLASKYDPYSDQPPFICMSRMDKNKMFKKVELLDENINSKNSEIAACISEDGITLYFSSDRAGGYGGKDIYISRKLPNGKWSLAFNMGPFVNTAYDEDFPNLSPDEKTIYFSSKGHTSMGGYDICKMTWDEDLQTWGDVKNMGYPLNTPDDDINLRISKNGRYGYVSKLREGGFGDLDIYRVTFNDVDPVYSIVKGEVVFEDTMKKIKYNKVVINVVNEKTKKIYGRYTPNPITGSYIIIVPPGQYMVNIEMPDFEPISEKLEIAEKIAFQAQLTKNFTITPADPTKSKAIKELNKKF